VTQSPDAFAASVATAAANKATQAITTIQGQMSTLQGQVSALQSAQRAASSDPLGNIPGGSGYLADQGVLMKGMIGTAIAGLDTSGNVTAPLNTSGPLVSLGAQQLGQIAAAPVLPNDIGSSSANAQAALPLITANFLWNNDGNENPNTLMVGGHGPWQAGALKVMGAPYTYGDDGCVVDVEMTNIPWWGSRCGSGDMDAVAQFINAGNTTPYYKVGQDFTDDTGVAHTLTFDVNGATVTPALPASFTSMWNAHGAGGGSGMWIVTNLLANPNSTSTPIPGFPSRITSDKWSGYVTGVTQGSGSTHLDMPAGWHPESGWVGVGGSNNGKVPDASVGYDTVYYSSYTHPIAFLGTFNQAFVQNMKCGLDFSQSGSPRNTILRSDAPVSSCQGNELDVYVPNNMPNGFEHVQGFTADLLSVTPLVSPDSQAFVAQGNWPNAYSTGLGTDGRDFNGGVLDVGSRRGPAGAIGATTEIMEATQGADAPTDVRSNMEGLRVTQVTDTLGYGGVSGVHYPADNSLHVGDWFGGYQFGTNGTTLGQYGGYQGDIVFNPVYAKGGVGVCGSVNGFTATSSSCVTVQAGGQVTISPNQTNSGVSLNVAPGGFTGGSPGSAGIALGTVPSGVVTALGAFLSSTYGNMIETITLGDANRRSLDASGNETLAGNLSVKGGNVGLINNMSINSDTLGSTTGLALPYVGYWKYSDHFHLDVPGGDITGANATGGIITPAVNDHSWLTYSGGRYVFNEATSGNTVNALLVVSDTQVRTYAPISAPSYAEALSTPASSTAACTTGQFTDDANYHYVCVATNTWKRVALSSF